MTSASFAADVPYGILIDGRPLDAAHRSGLNHNGVTYINVVRAVKTFDGLLTFDHGGVVRVSIGTRTVIFTLGSKNALLDGSPLRLSGAPFRQFGDTFVPLATVATLGHAKLTLDRVHHRALLIMDPGAGVAQPAPTST
jgi:hypothetical protein